jgi:hypothetical protein
MESGWSYQTIVHGWRRVKLVIVVGLKRYAGGLALASVMLAGNALAQSDEERAAARAVATEGVQAFDQGRYQEALDLCTRAEALMHAPTHLLLIARAQAKLGKLVKAHETYLKLAREPLAADAPRAFKEAQDQANQEAAAVEARTPTLTVVVDGEGAGQAAVTLDGASLPAPLVGVAAPIDPGEHRLRAKTDSAESDEVKIAIAEGAKQSVRLTLRPLGAKPADSESLPAAAATEPAPVGSSDAATIPWPTWIAWGVGAAGAVTGTVFLLKNRSDRDAANALCPGGPCPESKRGDIDSLDSSANTAATLSWIGYGVGVAGVATGLGFLLFKPARAASPQATTVRPWLGTRAAGVTVVF